MRSSLPTELHRDLLRYLAATTSEERARLIGGAGLAEPPDSRTLTDLEVDGDL